MYEEKARKRSCSKKTSRSNRGVEIEKEIKKEKKEKAGLSCCKINYFLKNVPNYHGCYSPDQLDHLLIESLPIKFILNLDFSNKEGSHWIAVRIDKRSIELFDSLGFRLDKWPSVPNNFFIFLQKMIHNRKLYTSRELQPSDSTLCGFYCIFYFLFREKLPFRKIVNFFSYSLRKNDKILADLLYKIK